MARLYWIRFAALLLAALSLTMETAHVLELPQKMRYDAQLYTAVNSTMYRYFALVGGACQVASIAAAGALAWVARGQGRASRLALAGALLLAAALAAWAAIVAPVNREIAGALASAPDTVPGLWMALRARWEYGHAAGFVVQLAGFACLLASALLPSLPSSHGRRAP